jgi:hypothetical protein
VELCLHSPDTPSHGVVLNLKKKAAQGQIYLTLTYYYYYYYHHHHHHHHHHHYMQQNHNKVIQVVVLNALEYVTIFRFH